MKTVVSILFSLLLSLSYGQHGRGGGGHGKGGHVNGHGNGGRGGGHHPHGKKVVVVHKSHYRPAHVRVYHPVWGSAISVQQTLGLFSATQFVLG